MTASSSEGDLNHDEGHGSASAYRRRMSSPGLGEATFLLQLRSPAGFTFLKNCYYSSVNVAVAEKEMKGGSSRLLRIVVGVGNQYMGDDGVGIEVARELKKTNLGDEVLVLERQMLDISLLLLSENACKLIVVDAIKAGRPPGTIVRFTATDKGSPGLNVPLSHDMQLADLVRLARKNKIGLCPTVVIGVEPADCTIGEGMTDVVKDSLPAAVQAVLVELRRPRRRNG